PDHGNAQDLRHREGGVRRDQGTDREVLEADPGRQEDHGEGDRQQGRLRDRLAVLGGHGPGQTLIPFKAWAVQATTTNNAIASSQSPIIAPQVGPDLRGGWTSTFRRCDSRSWLSKPDGGP